MLIVSRGRDSREVKIVFNWNDIRWTVDEDQGQVVGSWSGMVEFGKLMKLEISYQNATDQGSVSVRVDLYTEKGKSVYRGFESQERMKERLLPRIIKLWESIS